jgi:hypothetical protein
VSGDYGNINDNLTLCDRGHFDFYLQKMEIFPSKYCKYLKQMEPLESTPQMS